MRIGINAFPLRNNGGGARYVFTGLLDALLRADETNHYLIFAHLQGLKLIHQVVHAHALPFGTVGPDPRIRVIEVNSEQQIYDYRNEFDLLFGPLNNLKPRVYDRPTVAILHDIQEQYFPEYFSKSELLGRYEEYPEIAHSATTLIAISEFCKQSFVEKFGVDARKIEVVYNAPQAKLVGRDDPGTWSRDPLPEGYLFYPANCYKHKNHQLLLDAVERMRAAAANGGPPCPPVVFSGFEFGAAGFQLSKEIVMRRLGDICRMYTDLPTDEMRYLYVHAAAVVMPTLFEGFGMPAVEALACGTPLVCSDLPALREVAGDHAIYFAPFDVHGLIAGVRRIQDDPSIRASLPSLRNELLDRFSWSRSARKVLKIFDEAIERYKYGYAAAAGSEEEDSVSVRGSLPVHRPRIGVALRVAHQGRCLVETLKSILTCGYPNLVIKAVIDPEKTPKNVLTFLEDAAVDTEAGDVSEPFSPEYLKAFAAREGLEIVGEVVEGNTMKLSAFDSLAWGAQTFPDKPVLLGEAVEWRHGRHTGYARLRFTGDKLWKLDGFLHPEILFFRPSALEGLSTPQQPAGPSDDVPEFNWRWEIVRKAREDGRLAMLRRTLADCDAGIIDRRTMLAAGRVGMFEFQSVDGKPTRVRLLRKFEPAVKAASRVLPMKWQDAGTRVWYAITR